MQQETYCRVPITSRDGNIVAEALVDPEDFDRIAAHPWCLRWGYARRHVKHPDGKWRPIHMHREIIGEPPPGMTVDHVNRNPLDNRRENLRLIPRAGNQQNLTPYRGARSRHRGVCLHKASGLWFASATIKGVRHCIGYFRDEDEAGEAARQWRLENMPYATD